MKLVKVLLIQLALLSQLAIAAECGYQQNWMDHHTSPWINSATAPTTKWYWRYFPTDIHIGSNNDLYVIGHVEMLNYAMKCCGTIDPWVVNWDSGYTWCYCCWGWNGWWWYQYWCWVCTTT